MATHTNQPQAPDLQQMIADLQRVEDLTRASPEEFMAMDDTLRKRIDAEAGILHERIALQLLRIRQTNEEIRRRLDATLANGELIATAQRTCAAMQISFPDFVLYSAGQRTVPLEPELEKRIQIVGMCSVHAQARLIRQALEQVLQQL